MKIQLEVFAILKEKLKDRLPGGRGEIEVPEGATIDQVAEQMDIPNISRCAVMVNNQMPEDRAQPLTEDSKLTIIPPVAGG